MRCSAIRHILSCTAYCYSLGLSIAIGFLIGVSGMLTAVNFMDSIFWGQLSGTSPWPSLLRCCCGLAMRTRLFFGWPVECDLSRS